METWCYQLSFTPLLSIPIAVQGVIPVLGANWNNLISRWLTACYHRVSSSLRFIGALKCSRSESPFVTSLCCLYLNSLAKTLKRLWPWSDKVWWPSFFLPKNWVPVVPICCYPFLFLSSVEDTEARRVMSIRALVPVSVNETLDSILVRPKNSKFHFYFRGG